ncbi:hypothetical protein B0T20DRAFT_392760 [Sordaria brevicollis]|uniref:Uncharacterized protein n=1 Tax=Sordaria brevicollis TaxID=83679 RepID=A0AAE0PEK0_SORBR|nr:hypothetical protein B0T20DRAFT_392760 [Sordaria brevicollis]
MTLSMDGTGNASEFPHKEPQKTVYVSKLALPLLLQQGSLSCWSLDPFITRRVAISRDGGKWEGPCFKQSASFQRRNETGAMWVSAPEPGQGFGWNHPEWDAVTGPDEDSAPRPFVHARIFNAATVCRSLSPARRAQPPNHHRYAAGKNSVTFGVRFSDFDYGSISTAFFWVLSHSTHPFLEAQSATTTTSSVFCDRDSTVLCSAATSLERAPSDAFTGNRSSHAQLQSGALATTGPFFLAI